MMSSARVWIAVLVVVPGCRGDEVKPAPTVEAKEPAPPPADAAPDAQVIPPAKPVTLSCPAGSTQVNDTYLAALSSSPLLTEVVCQTAERVRNGPFQKFDQSGELVEEGTYANDRLDGAWTSYRNGSRKQVGSYAKDSMTGVWTSYHANGKVDCESHREGDVTTELNCFDERGRRLVRGKSPGGVNDGMWDWFEDGKPASSILYKAGAELKFWIYPGGRRTEVSKQKYDEHIYKKP